jgi:carboxyl-terminal processing protease
MNRYDSRSHSLVAMALGIGLVGGVWLDRIANAGWLGADGSLDYRLIQEAWTDIRRHFVQRARLSSKAITYGALSGMVDALGDTGHSRFLSPQMVKQLQTIEKNRFEGIGAEVSMKNGHVVIVAPLPESPAMRAGLAPGDIVLKVNGEDVAGLPLDQVVTRISGPAGSVVTLTILDPATEQRREFHLTRAKVTIHDVQWQRLPGTDFAHLHLAGFDKGSSDELQKTLAAIDKEHLTGIILDLRNNPGGLLNEAVNVASQFLPAGTVLEIKDVDGKITKIPVKPHGLATKIPLAVLVNEGSASAAEIVAGALQDAGRCPLVGEKTFGTGTVLSEFPLSDGSALLLAVEEWLTPDGHVIWHKGIKPDEEVALATDKMPLLPENESHLTVTQLSQSGDTQLLRAMQLLENRRR